MSRTFTFTIQQSDPSAKYLIDYGDNSNIDFPRLLNQSVALTHTYPSSGIFMANVTVFNSVSSNIIILTVNF